MDPSADGMPSTDLPGPGGQVEATGQLIGGRWRPGRGERALVVTEPATGAVLAELTTASAADVDDAVAGANAAAAPLEALTFFARAELLHRCADLIDERHDAIAEQLAASPASPSPPKPTTRSASRRRSSASQPRRSSVSAARSSPAPTRTSGSSPSASPTASTRSITPWNFPLNIPAELLAAALAAGDPAILKPSEQTPLTAAALAAACVDAGFPPGAVSVVQGFGDVGRALVTHDDVHGIGFVGSNATAEAIVRAAGMKRTLIEASGNGPQIVCDDAAIDAAAAAAVFGAHYVAGQCCVATERLLVQESIHDALVERIVHHGGRVRLGDPLDASTTMGPLNNEAVAAKMDTHVADARAKGATVLLGGGRAEGFPTDLYYELTVIDGVTPDMAVFREESFGPVVPITTFADDDEAIALANDSDLGLQAAVFTSSLTRAYRYIERLRTGTVIVNDTVSFWETHPPFGGAAGTRTGWGRIGGRFTMLDMTDLRTAVIDIANTRDGN